MWKGAEGNIALQVAFRPEKVAASVDNWEPLTSEQWREEVEGALWEKEAGPTCWPDRAEQD